MRAVVRVTHHLREEQNLESPTVSNKFKGAKSTKPWEFDLAPISIRNPSGQVETDNKTLFSKSLLAD